MPEIDLNTIIGAIVLLLSSVGSSVIAVRSLLGPGAVRRILAAMASDVERRPDGAAVPKPETDSELLADAIATRVLDRTEHRFERIEDRLKGVEDKIAEVQTEQESALEREAENSRRIHALQLSMMQRVARVEGALAIAVPQAELDPDATPVQGIPLERPRIR